MKLTPETLAAILDAVKKDYVWRAGDEFRVTRDPVNDLALLLDHIADQDTRLAAADKLADAVDANLVGGYVWQRQVGAIRNAARDYREACK